MTNLDKERPREYPSGTSPMADDEAAELAGEVPGWRIEDGSLVRDFEFRNFQEAFAFLCRVALLAEANGNSQLVEQGHVEILHSHSRGLDTQRLHHGGEDRSVRVSRVGV